MKKFTKLIRLLMLLLMGFLLYAPMSQAQNREITGDVVCNIPYIPGATMDFNFTATWSSPDWEYFWELDISIPAVFVVNSASAINGHPAIITGNDIHWDCHFFSSGGSTNFTINMDVDPGLTGDHLFDWHIWGDVYGNPPHDIAGQSPIEMGIPTIDGHVLNGTGQTIAGATVEVIEIGRTAITNATGYYTLYSIPDGTYNLIAYKTGYNTSDPVVITIIGGALVTQDFVLTQPSIVINPLIMNQTLHPNQYLIDYFGILNTGDGPLDWTAVIVYPPSDGDTEPIHVPAFTGEVEKDRQAPSTSLAPEELAKPGKPGEIYQTDNFRGSVAFGYQAIGDEFVNFDIDAVGAYTVVAYATTPNFVAGMAYPVGEEGFVYGVVYGSSNLYEIDVATGTWTSLGSMGASGFNDMTIDPTSGTYYGATSSALYEIDANAPSATLIGNFTNASVMIGIACDGDGNLWGYDVGYDRFYSIDKNTGLATSIGSLGFNANYAQCAFYDPETEQVLLGAFNAGNFYCEIRAVDVTTGGSVVLSSVYYKEMTAAAIPVGPGGWLSLGSYGGTVPPNGGTYNLDAHFNAGGFVAGDYVTADIIFSTYPDVGTITIPVSMTVLGFPFSMPYNLVATLMDLLTGEVDLTWDFDGDAFQYFIIYRDGVFAGSTTDQFFTDFLPGYGEYCYTVVAVYDEGQTTPAGPECIEWLIPDFCFSPAHPEEWVWTESEEFVDLEVTNCGQGLLAYTFPEYVALDIVNDPNIEQNKVGDPFAGQEFTIAKGEDDPRDGLGYPVIRGAGGPDDFGYVWIDSDEAGGPAYVWEDISATGTLVTGLGDDNTDGPFNIGWTFPFYGEDKTQFWIAANGAITFDNYGSYFSLGNTSIPTGSTWIDFIAWFWDDLDPRHASTRVWYQDFGDHLVIQFEHYCEYWYAYNRYVDAEVILYPNGTILINYDYFSSGFDMDGMTIGLQSSDNNLGLQVAYNTAYAHNQLALLFSLPAHFIVDVVPAYGTLTEGQSETVVMTYSGVGFDPGDYDEDLECWTNALAPNDIVFIPNTMHVYQPGEFAGTVTDGNTGAFMVDVEVTADIWQTTTAPDGTYSLYVDAGTYDVSFEKIGFQTVIVYDTNALAGVVTPIDIGMFEEAYPPGFVTATVNYPDDTECLVEWALPWGPYLIVYDDGSADDYFVWFLPGNANAVKFTPAGYPATVIGGKIYVGDGSFPAGGNFIGTTFGAAVYDDTGEDGLPGTQLDSIEVTVDNYGWVDFTGLSATIEDGDFFIAMFQGGVPPNTAPLGVDYTVPTVYRSYSYNAEFDVWALSTYQDFMIRAVVYGPQSDDGMAESTEIVYLTKPVKQDFLSLHAPNGLPGTVKSGEFIPITDGAATNRDVVSYTVARCSNFDPNGSPLAGDITVLVTGVTGLDFNDVEFVGLPVGWYAYGVKALYTNGDFSDYAVSNKVTHLMDNVVTLNISQCDGLSPEGAYVELSGQNYPYDVFATVVTEPTGIIIFDFVINGTYDLAVIKAGYYDYIHNNIWIYDDYTEDVVLQELMFPPRKLFVEPVTSIATWKSPYVEYLANEGFDEDTDFPPAGWSSTTLGDGWFHTDDGSSSFWTIPPGDGWYACANDDAVPTNNGCCDYLIMPELDLSETDGFLLQFDAFFNGWYSYLATVEYSLNGGVSWIVAFPFPTNSSWTTYQVDLDVLAGNASVLVAFHGNDQGVWSSGVAVDNVMAYCGSEPVGYYVYLNGGFVGETPGDVQTYQYQDLVYGQTYEAEVRSLYSCGTSDPVFYTFTSEYLYPPRNLTDEYVWGTNEVPLYWNPPMAGPGPIFSNVENGTVTGTTDHSIKAAPTREYSGGATPGTIEFADFRNDHTAYFMNVSNDELYSMDMADYSYSLIGPTVVDASSGDFMNDDTEMWYTTANWGDDLYSVNVTTGVGTYIAPTSGIGGMSLTGMACDRATNTMYVGFTDITTSGIGTIDLETGVITQIGTQTDAGGFIEIAIDGTGQMYAWCIVTDASYTVDMTTGAVTLLGPLGFNANYGQGGNWDQTDDVIYLTAYNISKGTEFRALDTETGGTVYLSTLPTSQNTAFGVPGTSGGGNVPPGLLSFNVYRDRDPIANVPYDGQGTEDWVMYVDNYVMPGCYDYEVTALYDLTDYGFPGETGESGMEGPREVCVGWGIDLPFFEDWDEGSFDLQGWTTNVDNWRINSQVGNPEPSAEFSWDPLLVDDYSATLTTSPLKADLLTDGDIFVDFELKLDDRNSTGEEMLVVQVKQADRNWVLVDTFANNGSYDFTYYHYKITDVAMGNIFQVRFNAIGQNSFDIIAWYVDNIHVYRFCAPPYNFEAKIEEFDSEAYVYLNWIPPGATAGEWISYNDGTFEQAFASTDGGAGLAQVFTPPQYPCTITQVRFFVDSYLNYYQNEEVYVLTGDGATILAGPYVVPGVEDDWVTVDVDDVTITEGTFMVATFNVLPDGPFIGVDDSYYDATLYFGTVGNFTELGEWGYFFIGSHEAYVEYAISDNVVVNSVLTSPQSNGLRADISESNTFSNGTMKPNRDLLGFNIFRSWDLAGGEFELIGYTTDTIYTDTLDTGGLYCYYATAVYDQCESGPSNDTCVECWVGIEELISESSVNVYPNPASDFVNVVSTENITKITVINYVGQVVYEKKVVEETSIMLNTASYETGVYMIKVETDDFIIVKRVTITR